MLFSFCVDLYTRVFLQPTASCQLLSILFSVSCFTRAIVSYCIRIRILYHSGGSGIARSGIRGLANCCGDEKTHKLGADVALGCSQGASLKPNIKFTWRDLKNLNNHRYERFKLIKSFLKY